VHLTDVVDAAFIVTAAACRNLLKENKIPSPGLKFGIDPHHGIDEYQMSVELYDRLFNARVLLYFVSDDKLRKHISSYIEHLELKVNLMEQQSINEYLLTS
jgi:hypothetical protein